MKRLVALLAAIAVLMSMSLTSFAAFSDEIADNGDGTYTAALSGSAATANAGKQTTIVAYKGNTISVGSIQYIDQAAATSFTFQLKDELTEDVKVVMGGEAIEKQEIGTIVYDSGEPEPSTYTISGSVTNYVDASFLEDELVPYVEEVFAGDDEAIAEYTESYVNGYSTHAKLYERDSWDDSIGEAYIDYYENRTEAPEAYATATVSAVDGSYSFSEIAAGNYVLVLERECALPYITYVSVVADNVTQDSVELILGDSLPDYAVDFTDIALLIASISDLGEEDYLSGNDVNVDLAVDFTDVATVIANLGEIFDYDTSAIEDLLG